MFAAGLRCSDLRQIGSSSNGVKGAIAQFARLPVAQQKLQTSKISVFHWATVPAISRPPNGAGIEPKPQRKRFSWVERGRVTIWEGHHGTTKHIGKRNNHVEAQAQRDVKQHSASKPTLYRVGIPANTSMDRAHLLAGLGIRAGLAAGVRTFGLFPVFVFWLCRCALPYRCRAAGNGGLWAILGWLA